MSRRNLLIGAGTIAAGLFAAPYMGIPLPNPFHTPGVQNIEKRYTAGGGSPNHLPATATKRGDDSAVEANQEKMKGLGTDHWKEHVGGQRGEPGSLAKQWNKVHTGTERGK